MDDIQGSTVIPERTAKTKQNKIDEMSPIITLGCFLEALSKLWCRERGPKPAQKDLTVHGKYEFEYLYSLFKPSS